MSTDTYGSISRVQELENILGEILDAVDREDIEVSPEGEVDGVFELLDQARRVLDREDDSESDD